MQSLTTSQLLALLGAARAHSERDWLMVLVGFSAGLRATEVISIKREDIRDGFLTVQRLKGSRRTTQLLLEHPEPLLNLRAPFLAYLENCQFGTPIFEKRGGGRMSRQAFWHIMQKHGATAGIPAHLRKCHVLKHSIAMQTIHSAGIENVRQHLGHVNISSTGAYLKVSDSTAASAIAKALES